MSQAGEGPAKPTVEELAYVWGEYVYRHDLCWRAVYKVTFAVVALAIVPYPKEDLTRALGVGALIPPLIAAVLAAFGILVVHNELKIFAKTKLAHHSMQNRFWDRALASPDQEAAKHHLTPDGASRTSFDFFVMAYMVILFLLSAANVVFVACRWLPRLVDR
jgi:hypothetical protein